MTTVRMILCSTIVLAGTLQSCLREDECPPEAPSLFVALKDKNYDNVKEIPQAVSLDEGLPLSRYVGSLDVRYAPVGSSAGSVLRRTVVPSADERVIRLESGSLAAGRYEITVAGSAVSAASSVSADGSPVELHPAQAEAGDPYLGLDTIDLPLHADRTILLHRAKGKLLLLYENFPAEITRLDIKVSGIYRYVDGHLAYTGTADAAKSFPLSVQADPAPLEFLLAPTDAGKNTTASIALYDAGGTPQRIFSNIPLSLARNRLSVLAVRYDPSEQRWEIWAIVEGEWVKLHQLNID